MTTQRSLVQAGCGLPRWATVVLLAPAGVAPGPSFGRGMFGGRRRRRRRRGRGSAEASGAVEVRSLIDPLGVKPVPLGRLRQPGAGGHARGRRPRAGWLPGPLPATTPVSGSALPGPGRTRVSLTRVSPTRVQPAVYHAGAQPTTRRPALHSAQGWRRRAPRTGCHAGPRVRPRLTRAPGTGSAAPAPPSNTISGRTSPRPSPPVPRSTRWSTT